MFFAAIEIWRQPARFLGRPQRKSTALGKSALAKQPSVGAFAVEHEGERKDERRTDAFGDNAIAWNAELRYFRDSDYAAVENFSGVGCNLRNCLVRLAPYALKRTTECGMSRTPGLSNPDRSPPVTNSFAVSDAPQRRSQSRRGNPSPLTASRSISTRSRSVMQCSEPLDCCIHSHGMLVCVVI